MEARFVNGTTVSRVWGPEDTNAELIGAFQYENNAFQFAELMAKDETRPATVFYVVTCHLSGKVKIVRPPKSLPSGQDP